ncbi:MAG: zinc-dependent metalloprotease [Actinobacteria bacterium]|nr:zinc-dependent metalloprotease [Actinomycetota bacterium]
MVDWFLAQRLARYVAGEPDARPPRTDLRALATDSAERVVAYTGLAPVRPLPPAEGVGRAEWIAANVGSMRALLDPPLSQVGEGLGPARHAMRLGAGALLTAEVGVLLGFLAQRVLGQYELVLLDTAPDERPPRLLFVLPNLGAAGRAFGADEREFHTWVALHEVTHAVQFAGVPWLQPHMAGMVRELLSHAEVRIDARRALRMPGGDDLKRLAAAVRSGDLVALVASDAERTTIERMQTTMAVLEGHAEHVMDTVGAPLLPSLPQLRAALDARRRSQSAPARLLQRLLGLEMKMRQYEQGKRFCDAIVREAGVEALNRVWLSPEMLPSSAELDAPLRWLDRTGVPRRLSA